MLSKASAHTVQIYQLVRGQCFYWIQGNDNKKMWLDGNRNRDVHEQKVRCPSFLSKLVAKAMACKNLLFKSVIVSLDCSDRKPFPIWEYSNESQHQKTPTNNRWASGVEESVVRSIYMRSEWRISETISWVAWWIREDKEGNQICSRDGHPTAQGRRKEA